MNKTIVLVDDTPDLLENLSEFLMMEGYTVIPCLQASVALEKLALQLPDLLITDLSMLDIDGFQLIEKIRGTPSWKHLPIVIFSARPYHENQARAISLEVTKYIKKPCAPDEFVRLIQQILKEK